MCKKTLRKPSKAFNFLPGAAKEAIFVIIMRLESEQYVEFRKTFSKFRYNELCS